MGAGKFLIVLSLVAALTWPRPSVGVELPSVAGYKTSFIPIPEIVTDPNEGNTVGLLGVFLFLNEKDEIEYMFAPDITHNDTKGEFPNLRFFGYPTPTRRYSVILGKSTTKDEDYEAEFADRGLWDGRAFVLAKFLHERDSTERFYGFGNDSKSNIFPKLHLGESNYTNNDTLFELTPGFYLLPDFHLSYRMRIRRYSNTRGQVANIPFTGDLHPEARDRGLETGVYWGHRIALTYDSRDDRDIPDHGVLALVYGEFADTRLGSSTSYAKWGAEWRDFVPILNGNPVIAMRVLLDYMSGGQDTPFWEMPSLGGRRTLRAFGGDRFIDFNRSLASLEVRTRVWQPHVFGVDAEIQVAPFIESGQVFHRIGDSPYNALHWVGGVGFRGLVRPQIVGFVDIGKGSEGFAVFTGVDYPF